MKPSILPLYQTGVINRGSSPTNGDELLLGGGGDRSSPSSSGLFQCISIPFRKLYYYRKSTIVSLLTLAILSTVYLDYVSVSFGSPAATKSSTNDSDENGSVAGQQHSKHFKHQIQSRVKSSQGNDRKISHPGKDQDSLAVEKDGKAGGPESKDHFENHQLAAVNDRDSKIKIHHLTAKLVAEGSSQVNNDPSSNNNLRKTLASSTKETPSEDFAAKRLTSKRRNYIVGMMRHAWNGYRKYAWGSNELRPISKSPHSSGIFGSNNLGASIIDAIDTLYIMDLKEEYSAARDWIAAKFNIKSAQGQLSVFETNIRFLGGLLSAFALTKDPIFQDKAREVADVLLPAFNTPTGIPNGLVSPKSQVGSNWGWAAGGSSILSEFGSLHLEFHYLADITGDKVYFDKVNKIRDVLNAARKPRGLYSNYMNPKSGKFVSGHVSVGALGDSFYEYLIKSWWITRKKDSTAKKMWDDAIAALEKNMLVKSEKGLWYFAEMFGNTLDYKFSHLACFIGGSYAMASWDETLTEGRRNETRTIAAEIARTCHESYRTTETGIGPEAFRFDNGEPHANNPGERYYILRPEVVETWFYLWRTTHHPKYRDWAWNAVLAIEKYCKSEAGYSGIRNVYSKRPLQDDVQQSFFLAETLKYLYLIFADDKLPLDKWVFNTEAHPLPVRDSQMLNEVPDVQSP